MKTKKWTGVATSAIQTLQLPEVDLRLLARAGLKAHRRPRRPPPRRPQRLQRALHLLIAAGEALRPELAEQDDPIPADLRAAPLQKLAGGRRSPSAYTRGVRGRHAPRRRQRLIVFLSTPSSRAIVLTCSPRANRASTSRTTSSRSIQPSTGVPVAGVEPTSVSDRPWSSPSEWRGDFQLISPGGTFT